MLTKILLKFASVRFCFYTFTLDLTHYLGRHISINAISSDAASAIASQLSTSISFQSISFFRSDILLQSFACLINISYTIRQQQGDVL